VAKVRALTVTKTALMPASSTYKPPEPKASPSFPPRRRNHRMACAGRMPVIPVDTPSGARV